MLNKNKINVYNEIKYKRYKNKLQNVIRNAKKSYYGSKIEENKTNVSKSWKILKELVTSNERVQCNTEFVDGEVCVDNMQQVVNKFNDCFVNLGPGLAEKITLQSAQRREYLKGDYLSSMFLEPALEDEVRIIILNLKNSSPGWDDNIACNTHCILVSRNWHCTMGVKKKQRLSQFLKVVIRKCSKTIDLFKNIRTTNV